jgi:hypothetical protein
MWRNWLDYCEQVQQRAKDVDAAGIVVALNGDIVDGDHHRTTQVITHNETTQMRLAYDVLKPLIEQAGPVYVIRGTEAHVGGSGRIEEKIAEDISAVKQGDNYSAFLRYIEVHGTSINLAHHGKLGGLKWTKANGAHSLAGEILMTYADRGEKPPHLVIRSHFHQYADTYHNYESIRLIATPGWQLATAFVHKIKADTVADIGGLIITCWPGGVFDVDVVINRLPKRRPEKVTLP